MKRRLQIMGFFVFVAFAACSVNDEARQRRAALDASIKAKDSVAAMKLNDSILYLISRDSLLPDSAAETR